MTLGRVARSGRRRQLIRALAAAGMALAAAFPAAAAEPFRLDPPLAGCALGRDCWPLILFDHDATPGVRDFTCAQSSYDGHDGVDFGVIDRTRLADDIFVVAAAPGTVTRMRDGETDGLEVAQGRAAAAGRDCGNAVVIEHGDGWVTQYCHLRRGSLLVKPGDVVKRGQKLGLVGMSGLADFPHVHLSVRQNNRAVDPFAPDGPPTACPAPTASTPVIAGLWSDAARAQLAHAGAAIVGLGLSPLESPERWRLRGGLDRTVGLTPDAPGVSLWADLNAPDAGDILRLRLIDPSGREITSKERRFTGPAPLTFTSVWHPRPEGGFALGVWTLEATSRRARDGREDRRSQKFIVAAPKVTATP